MSFRFGRFLHPSNTPTKEGHLSGNKVGKYIIPLAGLLVMLFAVVPNACAEKHVITMYFGGTGLPENGWHEDNTRWDSPSLLATMHRNHVAGISNPGAINHHKFFVAGVGAPPDCGGFPKTDITSDAFLQQAFPHKGPECRTWTDTVNDGVEKLRYITDYLSGDDTVMLNIIGHSRGAIASIWFFKKVIEEVDNPEKWIKKINLITLEPVPGINLVKGKYDDLVKIPGSWETFRLNKRLDKYVAIFAQDERSFKFGAVIPHVNDTWYTDTWMFRVRGSHQTMAGNLWIGGHSPTLFPIVCLYPYTHPVFCAFAKHAPELINIHNLVAVTLVELLSGLEWGLVEFDNQYQFLDDIYGLNAWKLESTRKLAFLDLITTMNDPALNGDYELMQITGFFPGTLRWWGPVVNLIPNPIAEFNGTECLRIKFKYTGLFTYWSLDSHLNRCVEKVLSVASDHKMGGLETMRDIPLIGGEPVIGGKRLSGEGAWNKIREMSKTDTDKDGVSDDIDNCPLDINPGQGDIDGDDVGDVCDPDRDGDGLDNESDNCPFRSNADQANSDGDAWGDVCDFDRDGDGANNDEDICPWYADPLQLDTDGDGEGDVCDNCPFTVDADEVDDDEDMVGDVCDNCLGLKNTPQTDSDSDGLGNACDICPFDVNPEQLDSDGDGQGDACDNCPYTADPTEADEDDDLVGDVCDNCPDLPNTDQADIDNDGIGDVCDLDNDEDGIPDDTDMCPDTPVVGEAVDPVLGCSLIELVPCEGPRGTGITWANHDEYVQAMEVALIDFKNKGLLTTEELEATRTAIRDNNCGNTWVEAIPVLSISGVVLLILTLFGLVRSRFTGNGKWQRS